MQCFVFLLFALLKLLMQAAFSISLERAKAFSSVAERALTEPLPVHVPTSDGCENLESNVTAPPPSLLPHQRMGVEWLLKLYYNGLGGILADEMGLGKTVQIASLFETLLRLRSFGTHLVVAPLVTLDNWEREIKKWCPLATILVFHGNKGDRETKRRWLANRQRSACANTQLHSLIGDTSSSIELIAASIGTIVITSFEMVMSEGTPLASTPFDILVVDEAHRLKNTDCKLIRTLRRFRSDTRILLTGTPLQNNLNELWSIINFVMPAVFPSSGDFEEWAGNEDSGITTRTAKRMQFILKPLVLRRTKSDIETLSLPPKYQVMLRVPLSQEEQQLYMKVRKGEGTASKLNNKLMHLRKVCCHPFLFDDEHPYLKLFQTVPLGEWSLSDKRGFFDALIKSGSKLRTLHRMLRPLQAAGHRVLIFSQFTSVLDIIEEYLYLANCFKGENEIEFTHSRLDGSNSREEKGEMVANFSGLNPPFCFLISTKSGGVGINLTAADTVILYDCDFNPQNDYQAIDRAHRIGQTKPVVVYRLMCSDTIEEAMISCALGKVQMERAILGGDTFKRMEPAESLDDETKLKMTMQYNFGKEVKALTDEELGLLLDRSYVATMASEGEPDIPAQKKSRSE